MIYFLQPTTGGAVKIGFSDNVRQRQEQLEYQYRQPLAVLATMEGDKTTEREIHERFSHLRLGRTEQFRPASDLMAFIGRPLLVAVNPDSVEAMSCHLKPMIVQLRGSEEFKAWVEEVADFDRSTLAVLVEKALIQYVKNIGFDKPAPRR